MRITCQGYAYDCSYDVKIGDINYELKRNSVEDPFYEYLISWNEAKKKNLISSGGRGIFTIKSTSCCQMFRNKCVSITANGLDREMDMS